MATQHFGLLEEREETELHKTRLLAVEERPFRRLTKRLVAPGAFTNPTPSKKLATPPPEGPDGDASTPTSPSLSSEEITALKEDIVLDFAAFDSAIARLQLLSRANAAEREHYASTRLRILSTMDSVRESNAELHSRLASARETLARRRTFDELADKITSNRMLRTRAEQGVNLAKLAEECEELRRESEAYADTWRERRAQFERLVDEGRRLRALIRD
ncbi:Tho complex subunit 7-domain-containing protein, partial [Xylariaceae sp. FL0594]